MGKKTKCGTDGLDKPVQLQFAQSKDGVAELQVSYQELLVSHELQSRANTGK